MLPATITKGITSSNIMSYLLRGGFFIAIATATFLVLRSVIRRVRRNNITNKFGSDTAQGRAAQYAANFYQGIFPSGIEWLSDFMGDGTDSQIIFSTAQEVYANSSMTEVVKAYRKLYNRDLIIDLQKDLSSSEFAKFNRIVNEGLGSIRVVSNKLISSRPTMVYTESMIPLGIVKGRTCFGGHMESIIENNGRVLHGFDYKGQMRFVNADDVLLVEN